MNVEITVFHNAHSAYETTEEARHSTPDGEPCGPFMGTSCERCKYIVAYTATVSTEPRDLYVNPLDVIEALWVHDQMETSPTGFTIAGGRDPKAQRSLSMGDVVRYGDDAFLVCETVGWKALDGAPADIAA